MSNYNTIYTDISTKELVNKIVDDEFKMPITATLKSDGNGNVDVVALEKNHKKKEHMMLGFGIYYKNPLRWILEDIIGTNKAKILSYIMKNLTKDGYIMLGSNREIADKTGVHRNYVSKILNELKREEVIDRIDNKWYYNPFILNVPTNSFSEIARLQSRWNELYEAYIRDKKTNKYICKYRPDKESE